MLAMQDFHSRQVQYLLPASVEASPIDASLACGIRRSYFRTLIAAWDTYAVRRKRAEARNRSFSQRVGTQRQLRDRVALLEELLGPLIPISVMQMDARSRGGAVLLGLCPEPVPAAPKSNSSAQVNAWVLLRPGRAVRYEVSLMVSGHAIDRIIQRARIVDTPISRADIQAINAEFADALPLAVLALQVIALESFMAMPPPTGCKSCCPLLTVRCLAAGAKKSLA